MAWTTISNLLVGVGAKPFATTVQALRDNPIAIADGDANAPRIQFAALGTLITGTTIRMQRNAQVNVTDTSYPSSVTAGIYLIGFIQPGQVNLTAEHNAGSGESNFLRFCRVRNGSLTQLDEWQITNSGYTAREGDYDVLPGDALVVQSRSGGAYQTEIRNFRLRSAAATKIWPSDNFGFWNNMS